MLVAREVLLAKVETTYNTDAAPAANTDAVLVENLNWSFEGARMHERKPIRSSIGKLQQVFGGTLRSVSFDVELKGPGAAYSASVVPEIGVLLRGCGMAETIDTTAGSETVTYQPASQNHDSLTLYYYQDGQLVILTGCRGNVQFSLEGGAPAKASFTFTGHSNAPTDVALPSPSYDSTVPAPFIGAAFDVGGYPAVISKLDFDMGNTIATPPDVNSADGFGAVQITARDVNGSFDPEHQLVATKAFENEWRTGASMALTTGTIGSTQYNRFAISKPAISYREISLADRDGVRTLGTVYGAHELTTDDEVSIVFS